VEGLSLLLGFLAIDQEFFAKELGPVELDPLCTLFSECNYWCWYLIAAEFSYYLPGQGLGEAARATAK